MKSGRYDIIRDLAKGGWGEVSLARDMTTGAEVALKKMALQTDEAREIAEKETQTLSQLNHPYVVKIVDSFIEAQDCFIVTEFISGASLEALCADGPLDLGRAKKYAGQIVEALEYIHSRGIIHSDLKPANVIIDAGDNVRIIDFGIVRTASAEIASDIKDIRGTLHYLSPEQAEGRPYDVRSDLFSLGVMLYEICTGKKPFQGDYDMAVMYAILYENPVAPNRLDPRISQGLSTLIMEMLEKDPAGRPASATLVRQAVGPAFDSCGAEAGAVGRRIAILPLNFPQEDEGSKLIAEGLFDEINERLKQLPDLEVVSPIKINQYAPQLSGGAAIRELVGADHYLKGNILKAENRIRIYMKLFASADDAQVWTYRYDNPMSDLFDIIDMITENVTSGLKLQFQGETTPVKSTRPTSLAEAYELYLLGRNYYVKNTRKDIEYAKNMYTQALKLDPNYALALVGLADSYCLEYMNFFDRSDEIIHNARGNAEQALRISPDLPEAYRAMGRIMHATGDHKHASLFYLKAVTYKEDYFQAYRSLGWLSLDSYRYDEALQWVRKSLSINSTELETIYLKGIINFERKDSKSAVNDFTRCLELRPDYGRAHFYLGMTYFQMGRLPQAIAAMEQAVQFGGDINAHYLLGYYHTAQGNYLQAIDILNDAVNEYEIAFISHFYLGLAHSLHGNAQIAATNFEKSLALANGLIYDNPDFVVAKLIKAVALAFLVRREEALAMVSELSPTAEIDGSIAHDLARVMAVIGEIQSASRYIKKAIESPRGPSEEIIAADPILKKLVDTE